MALNLNELEKQLLQLSSHERAFLAKQLLRSLDGEDDDDPELERKWIEEANRRYKDYKSGKTTAKNADEVMRDARSKLS